MHIKRCCGLYLNIAITHFVFNLGNLLLKCHDRIFSKVGHLIGTIISVQGGGGDLVPVETYLSCVQKCNYRYLVLV